MKRMSTGLGLALVLGLGPAYAQDAGVIRDEAVAVQPVTAETPPTPAASAIDVVRDLYGQSRAPRSDLTRFFTNELAAALEADLATRLPAVSADYRYDLPETPRGTPSFEPTDGASGAGVIVSFSEGRIMVELCRRDDGQWRIVDIRDPDEIWTTRAFLELPPTPVTDCDA